MPKTLLAVLACLVLVACASGESADVTEPDVAPTEAPDPTQAPDTTMAPATTAGPTTTAGESGAGGTITMENISFSGASSAEAGETIELVNNDQVPHTFTAEDESFDVSVPPGETVTYTFEEAGEYSYFCSIHPSMEGVITVEG